ncbi:MAG: IS256 family transposase [Gemmatimonadetes bacterium]|nr:IS256 family transposase [Gemmatimonadota bacterium]
MLRIIEDGSGSKGNGLLTDLDELAREGARRMLVSALDAEVAEYVERHRRDRDEEGRAQVVRNGKARPRKVTLGCGTVAIAAPRVNDRRVREQFTSRILPPYMRRSPKVAEVLPVLYLRGLSTGDFREALPILLGDDASGLSPTTITRLTAVWEDEYREFRRRDLSDREYVYIWVDGIHFNIRLEEDRLCTLVMLGARADGTKELIAVEDGYRESTESWLAVLRDLKRRGMRAPVLAIGDGALGFWAAVREVWPATQQQRDWVHRMANVLDKLPKRMQPAAKRALREMMYAESRAEAEALVERFDSAYVAKYPKAVASLTRDQEYLYTHFDFPAEHWKHIRSTNVIESAFATVRLRQRVTKGAGSRTKGLTMVFKLLEMAQQRWRKLNAPQLLPLVLVGERFNDGIQETDREKTDRKVAA